MLISAPTYNPTEPIKFYPSGNTVIVNWSSSFEVNGPLVMYVLYSNGFVEYAGVNTQYAVLRDGRSTSKCSYHQSLPFNQSLSYDQSLLYDQLLSYN